MYSYELLVSYDYLWCMDDGRPDIHSFFIVHTFSFIDVLYMYYLFSHLCATLSISPQYFFFHSLSYFLSIPFLILTLFSLSLFLSLYLSSLSSLSLSLSLSTFIFIILSVPSSDRTSSHLSWPPAALGLLRKRVSFET